MGCDGGKLRHGSHRVCWSVGRSTRGGGDAEDDHAEQDKQLQGHIDFVKFSKIHEKSGIYGTPKI